MATQRIIDKKELSATTTDGTTAQILGTYPIPTTGSAMVIVEIAGRDTSNNQTVIAKQATGVKNTAGTVTLVGSVANLIGLTGDVGLVTALISFDISGTSLRAKVTGVALKNIEWWGEMKIIIN